MAQMAHSSSGSQHPRNGQGRSIPEVGFISVGSHRISGQELERERDAW